MPLLPTEVHGQMIYRSMKPERAGRSRFGALTKKTDAS